MDTYLLDQFAAYQRAKNLSENTIRNRRSILSGLSTAVGSPFAEMTLGDLRLRIGRPDIAAGSRRTERGAMIAFFTFLCEDGIRTDNPAARLAPVEAPKGEPRPFTREQVDAMLTSGAYKRTRAMILVGYYQGFRVSSIARVHGHDVDLTAMTIRTVGKGGKVRTLPLHPVIADLAKHMPPDTWWFPARKGASGHIRGAAVTNLITRAKKRAGIRDPDLTPHSLRHAFGTDLVEEGVDIRVVKELMMHESLATTQIYTGVSARRKQEGIRTLPAREIPRQSGRGARIAA
ncbi:tyrosine-type recombinase/integrase [Microbacterium sp. A204]|uniref:tyrosine-type recombinase/integrase n=1 Tax=Microbacterium sp. A204 TaxID=3457321 RepID=UPI003FD2A3AA